MDVAVRLAEGAPTPFDGRNTRSTTGCVRPAPIFDASLGMEFLGFSGHELPEGTAAPARKSASPDFSRDGV
jgi:hypothetical protein